MEKQRTIILRPAYTIAIIKTFLGLVPFKISGNTCYDTIRRKILCDFLKDEGRAYDTYFFDDYKLCHRFFRAVIQANLLPVQSILQLFAR